MAYFKLDRGQSVDTSYVVVSLLMSGFVANTAFMGCMLLLSAWLGITVWDPIFAVLADYRSSDLVMAKITFFLAIAIALPLAYIFIWRPIAAQMLETRNWLMHSVGFGTVLSGFVTMMAKLFITNPSVSLATLLPLAISIVIACFCLGGMIRLRELNQLEV